MIETEVLIVGAGLAGLSTAYHLRRLGGPDFLLAEREPKAGGNASTEPCGGFLFDRTGHLLHLHDPEGRRLVAGLLAGNLAVLRRDAWIHSCGVFTRYPFQANTYGLPAAVVEECLAGFLETVHHPRRESPSASFRDWCLARFGTGICRRFMFPYNEKVWRAPLGSLTTDWQGPFVPKPAVGDVLAGALTDQDKPFGYNATFRYPVRGGIQALPDALAARLAPGRVRLGSPLRSIDLAARVAVVEGVGEVRFRRVVNTMPLPAFLDAARPLPSGVAAARRRLCHVRVLCLNIGIDRPDVSRRHWVYFPERKFPFYRAGFSSNFSRHVAPPGTTSMYIESSRRPGERVDLAALEGRFLGGLRACGILKRGDRILARQWVPIDYGYVVYDRARRPAVETILSFLRRAGAESIGRYGGWKYSFMEEALLEGKRCAERLCEEALHGRRAPSMLASPRGRLTT